MFTRWTLLVAGTLLLIPGTARGAVANGYAFKEGAADHSGIKVEALTCLTCLEKFTDSLGHYGPWVAIGGGKVHSFRYTCPGYQTTYLDHYIPFLGAVELPDVTLPRKMGCDDLPWQEPDYSPEGSEITFYEDDAQHKPYWPDFPVEWWYVNFHLTEVGDPGREYGAFVAFFKEPRLRLFAISDLELGDMFTDTPRLCPASLISDHWLDLTYCHAGFGGDSDLVADTSLSLGWEDTAGASPEMPAEDAPLNVADTTSTATVFGVSCDKWYNRKSGGDPLPYEYHLKVEGKDAGRMLLDVDLVSLKAPLMVGGDGLVDIGDGQSRYYSYSRMDVAGTLQVHGRKAEVVGEAWVDHQWGDFLPQDISWEWFSIQLDDFREIMVADLWVGDQLQGSYSGGLNLFDEDCVLEVLPDYTITTLDTAEIYGQVFGTRWRIEASGISLEVTADFADQAVCLTECYVFTPCFWEGSCTVTGTIDGQDVAGKAYVESTHWTEDGSGSFGTDPGGLDFGTR